SSMTKSPCRFPVCRLRACAVQATVQGLTSCPRPRERCSPRIGVDAAFDQCLHNLARARIAESESPASADPAKLLKSLDRCSRGAICSSRRGMLARLRTAALFGVEACPVHVEVDVSFGMPGFKMVGLPD